MSEVKCLIVDDEPLAMDLLEDYINQSTGFGLLHRTHNPVEALQFLQDNVVDLLFLDIQMPKITGMELIGTLKNPPAVIFTTAYRDYAVESYDHGAIDYLVKPISYVRFFQSLQKYLETYSKTDKPSIDETVSINKTLLIKSHKKYHQVPIEEIKYLESQKEYVHLILGSKTISTKATMEDIQKLLPTHFIRIHRSFIINRHWITAFTHQDVEIGDKEIPIGGVYKREVLAILTTT